MKIYNATKNSHTILITPGKEFPDVKEWSNDAKEPMLFPVLFRDGVAEVDAKMGKYLIDKGFAFKERV